MLPAVITCSSSRVKLGLPGIMPSSSCSTNPRIARLDAAQLSYPAVFHRELHQLDAVESFVAEFECSPSDQYVQQNASTLARGSGCSGGSPVGQRGGASPVLELEPAGSVQQAAVPAAVGRLFRLVRRRPIQFATPRRRFLSFAAPAAISTHATTAQRKHACPAAEKSRGERRADRAYDFDCLDGRRHGRLACLWPRRCLLRYAGGSRRSQEQTELRPAALRR